MSIPRTLLRRRLVLFAAFAFSIGDAWTQVATPTFSPNGGWFLTEQPVTVSCATAGATIYYTTNGVTPSPSDRTVVSGGTVLVDRLLTLKANATKTGMTASATATAGFTVSGKLAGGTSHSVALKSDGTVWTWGANAVGQLGIGSADANTHAAPVQVKTNATTFLTGMSMAGAGASHSLAIRKSDGSVFGWGNDASGQLGDNSTATQQVYPVRAKTTASGNPFLVGVVDVAGGASHTIALKSDGTVWTWGSNASGQLGDGGTTSRKLAAQVKTAASTFLTGVVAIGSGDNFCAAVKSDGTVWTWGVNGSGQLGIGSTTTQKFAVQVKLSGGAALTGVREIACGSIHAVALKTDGTVWAWGSNANGRLGNGTTTQANNPIQVKINSTTFFTGANAVAAGASHSAILKGDGSVYACGLNSSGQLSINSTTQQLYPTQSISSAGVSLSGIVDLACGGSHTLVTKNDGTVFGCGLNSSGQAGNPTTSVNPKACTLISNFLAIIAFADPDIDGLLTWNERELGTNPNSADSDGDGMPDGWEVNNNLNPLVSDGSADPDGDGFTNLYEYQHGTSPNDYFNGATFNLNISSGNGQTGLAGAWLPQPFIVQTTNSFGSPLVNAPVTFSLAQATGGISVVSGGSAASSLNLRTDSFGRIGVYYQQPVTQNLVSGVNAQAGTSIVHQVGFTASTLDLPSAGMKLWLKADAGITKDGNENISAWLDQSPSNFGAAQSSGGNQPIWASSAAASLPGVYFDGNNRFFTLPDVMSTATQGELFVVLKTVGDQNPPHGFMRFGSGGQSVGPGTDILYPHQGQIYDAFGSTTVKLVGTPPVPLTKYHIYNASSKSGDWIARLNGQLQYTTSDNVVGFTNAPTIGALYYSFAGYISEIVIYDHVLTTADRNSVQNYLTSKYSAALRPDIPTNLTGLAITPTQATLNWEGQDRVKIERKVEINGTYSEISVTTTNIAVYNDANLSPNTQYFYRIRATNFAGDSSYSNEVPLTTPATGSTLPIVNLKLWLRADFGVIKDGSNAVSRWTDESGSGNDASQANPANSPLFVENGLPAKPVVRFNGSTTSMSGPLSIGTQMSIFAVAASGSNTGFKRIITNEGHFYFGIGGDGKFATFYGNGGWGTSQSHPNVIPANQFNILESINDGNDNAYINGQLIETRPNPMGAFSDGFELGRYPGGLQYWDSDIVEILIYDGALSTTDRQAVEAYLGSKYNGDTDGDGMPDLWELSHNLNPLVNDASADPDGDGFTNLQEYQNGTDPNDFFNGAAFNLNITGGNAQMSPAGTWLPQALTVHATNGSGGALINAPITFTVSQSGGGISLTSGGTTASSLNLYTDSTGNAAVYYHQPTTPDMPSSITAQAGTTTVKSVTFSASTADIPTDGLKLWLNAQIGAVYDAYDGVDTWADQSGNLNSAVWNSAVKPLYDHTAIAGKPAVRFTAASIYWYATSMAGPLTLGSQPSIFAAGTVNGLYGIQRIISNENNLCFGNDGYGNFATYFGDGTEWNNFQPHAFKMPIGQPVILESVNNGTANAYVNGVLFDSRPDPMAGFNDGYDLGRDWTGDLAEILVYDRPLSEAERKTVENYLNRRYNVVPAVPAAPNLTGIANTPTQTTLNWDRIIGTTFKIERKAGAAGTYAEIAITSTAGYTVYNDSSLTGGTNYFYRIRATNMVGDSAYSNEISLTTPATGATLPMDGLKLWLRGDFGVVTSGDLPVDKWIDESGHDNDGTSATFWSRALAASDSINGKGTLRFNGTSTVISMPVFLRGVANAAEGFVVLRTDSDSDPGVKGLWSFGSNYMNRKYYPAPDGTISDDFGSNDHHGGIAPPAGVHLSEPHLYGVVSQPGEWTARINQQVIATTSNNTVDFLPWAPSIGFGGGWNGLYTYFAGNIAEVLIFDRALSPTERAAVADYLSSKYGLTDADSNGTPDWKDYENRAHLDSDGDGLADWKEIEIGTDPNNADTNGDGLSDYLQYALGLDPTNLDVDGDGLTNAQEIAIGTNPFLADTDHDGVADGLDAYPLDSSRWQAPGTDPNDHTAPSITLTEPADAVLLP